MVGQTLEPGTSQSVTYICWDSALQEQAAILCSDFRHELLDLGSFDEILRNKSSIRSII